MRHARSPKEYKIHVGPVPRTTTVDKLLSHFRRFGPDVHVLSGRNHRGQAAPGSQLEKGFCTLVARSWKTAQSILDHPVQDFEGRRITCDPFIEGSRERQAHNQESNKRRIVVKNIPVDVNEEKLKEFFSAFGEVRYSYFLKPSASSSASLPVQRAQTASVQFAREAPAARLVAAKQVELQGCLVSLERFDPQHRPRSQGACGLPAQPPVPSPQPKAAPGPTLGADPASKTHSVVSSPVPPCFQSKVPQLIHQPAHKILDLFVIKPTCKSYHHDIKEQYEQWHNREYNLRFNTVLHVIASSPPATNIK